VHPADLPRIDVQVHQGRLGRQRLARARAEQPEDRHADREHDVVALQQRGDLGGERREGASPERVVGRQRHRGGQRLAADRRAQALGEAPERRPRARVGDAVARQDDRPAGGRQHGGRPVERLGVRRGRGRRRRRDVRRRGVRELDVDRQAEHDRPAGGRQGGAQRLGQQGGEVLRPAGLPGALGERPCHPDDVTAQERLARQQALLLLAHGHQQRHPAAGRVEDPRHGVGQAGLHVDVDRRRAAGRLGVAVGHAHGRRLVERQHVAHPVLAPEGVGQGQLGGPGVAEEDGHPLRGQGREQPVGPVSRGHRLLSRPGAPW
jgi:hypothetical protein